jgi:hypothetical protein
MSQQAPAHTHEPTHEHDDGCLPLPRFERIKYFYGQLLGVREFQAEQSYFLEKHRLHNRYLHGYGVVCGLVVTECRVPRDPCDDEKPHDQPAPSEPKDARQQALVHQRVATQELPTKLCLEVECGLALDCQGNEIVVPWPTQVDVIEALGCDAPKRLVAGERVYVSVCFKERPIEPVRPLSADACGGLLPDCVPSRLRDDFCIRVSWDKPPHDDSCTPCQRPCCEPCLPLAALWWDKETGLHIDNRLRRTIALYVPTKIAAISWAHDATYHADDVDEMFKHGLRIVFTDKVRTASLRRGVLDVWVLQGGGGRRGDIYNVPVEIEPSHPNAEYSEHVTAVVGPYRGDRIDPGDRVLVQLRSAFVVDRCCRAIDGDHIGGFVPQIPELASKWKRLDTPVVPPCRPPEPRPFPPWASGNGTPGGNFESWFYVGDDEKAH